MCPNNPLKSARVPLQQAGVATSGPSVCGIAASAAIRGDVGSFASSRGAYDCFGAFFLPLHLCCPAAVSFSTFVLSPAVSAQAMQHRSRQIHRISKIGHIQARSKLPRWHAVPPVRELALPRLFGVVGLFYVSTSCSQLCELVFSSISCSLFEFPGQCHHDNIIL